MLLSEANYMSKFELIQNIEPELAKEGVISFKSQIYIFDLTKGKTITNNNSMYRKYMLLLNNQWKQKAPENITQAGEEVESLSDLNRQNKSFMVIQLGGKSLKGTYKPEDYFYDSLKDLCGELKESISQLCTQMTNEYLEKVEQQLLEEETAE